MDELDCDQVVAFNDLRQYVIQVLSEPYANPSPQV